MGVLEADSSFGSSGRDDAVMRGPRRTGDCLERRWLLWGVGEFRLENLYPIQVVVTRSLSRGRCVHAGVCIEGGSAEAEAGRTAPQGWVAPWVEQGGRAPEGVVQGGREAALEALLAWLRTLDFLFWIGRKHLGRSSEVRSTTADSYWQGHRLGGDSLGGCRGNLGKVSRA